MKFCVAAYPVLLLPARWLGVQKTLSVKGDNERPEFEIVKHSNAKLWVWNKNMNLHILSHDRGVEQLLRHPAAEIELTSDLGGKGCKRLPNPCSQHDCLESLGKKVLVRTKPNIYVYKNVHLLEARKVAGLKLAPVDEHLFASKVSVQMDLFHKRRFYFIREQYCICFLNTYYYLLLQQAQIVKPVKHQKLTCSQGKKKEKEEKPGHNLRWIRKHSEIGGFCF